MTALSPSRREKILAAQKKWLLIEGQCRDLDEEQTSLAALYRHHREQGRWEDVDRILIRWAKTQADIKSLQAQARRWVHRIMLLCAGYKKNGLQEIGA